MSQQTQLLTVRIIGFPLDVWRRAQQHHEELMREFALLSIQQTQPGSSHDVPRRLLDLIDAVQARYAGVSEAPNAERDAAIARGEKTVDLTFQVPPEVKQACLDLDAMLDEADEYCRAGESLLTLASPPEAVAFRRWYLGEFVRQIDGEPPMPWASAR